MSDISIFLGVFEETRLYFLSILTIQYVKKNMKAYLKEEIIIPRASRITNEKVQLYLLLSPSLHKF